MLLGGRNSGKTITASNHIFEIAATLPYIQDNRIVRVAFIGETAGDVKKTMIEGKTGILDVLKNTDLVTAWNRSQGELTITLPESPFSAYRREILITSYSSQSPDQLRGPAFHLAWIDEVAKLEDANENPMKAGTTFSNLVMALRNGERPHMVVTGTPTGCWLVRHLRDHEKSVLHNMPSINNSANVPQETRDEWARTPATSRFARQEIYGEILEDNAEALFFQDVIDDTRAPCPTDDSDLRKVLGWDPSVSSGEDSDEAGIVIVGWTPERRPDRHRQKGDAFLPAQAYVLADRSGRYSPTEQTRIVVRALLEDGVKDLVFESNQGADFVLTQLHNELATQTADTPHRRDLKSKNLKYGSLKRYRFRGTRMDGEPYAFIVSAVHAQKGKQLRAETVSMKYDTGQVHHPPEGLPLLEREMTGWNPLVKSKISPGRLDACLVAGTMVSTATGLVPIEDVVIGDLVETREGWRPVVAAGPTRGGVPTPVVAVGLGNGVALTGTGDHRVWVLDKGWTRLDALVYADMLLPCANTSPSKVSGTPETLTPSAGRIGCTSPLPGGVSTMSFTGRSGRRPTVRSPKDGSSITSTRTRLTTISATSPACLTPSMIDFMRLLTQRRGGPGSTASARSLLSGTGVRQDGRGTASTRVRSWPTPGLLPHAANAGSDLKREGGRNQSAGSVRPVVGRENMRGSVERRRPMTSRSTASSAARSSVPIDTRGSLPVRVVAAASWRPPAVVYNLEVAGTPEYFANGVLAHNCTYSLLHIFGAKTLVAEVRASLSSPTPGRLATLPLEALQGPRGAATASIYSMDLMPRRGPN
jgi:phage terminase large subunit-like protein